MYVWVFGVELLALMPTTALIFCGLDSKRGGGKYVALGLILLVFDVLAAIVSATYSVFFQGV